MGFRLVPKLMTLDGLELL